MKGEISSTHGLYATVLALAFVFIVFSYFSRTYYNDLIIGLAIIFLALAGLKSIKKEK